MRNVVVTGYPRADLGEVGALTALGVAGALAAAKARAQKERASRAAFRHGELGLDRYRLHAVLAQAGVEYVDYQSYQKAPR